MRNDLCTNANNGLVLASQEVSNFFKKKAALEEDYGRNMHKLVRTTSEAYTMNDGKAGSVLLSHYGDCILKTR